MRIPHWGRTLMLSALIVIPWTATAKPAEPGALRADPALIQFIEVVVEANPRVKAARAALDASASFRDAAARPMYNPELSLDAENADIDTRAIGISQALDWGGKRKARTAVAESDRLTTKAQYLSIRWEVTVALLQGLAQHQTGLARDTLAQSRKQWLDRFANLAQRRFDAGDLPQVELNLARLAATDARIERATAAVGVAEARQAVRNLTSQSTHDQWPSLPDALPALPEVAMDPESLVIALPHVVAARRQVETADAVVELRRREQRPDPTLSLAGGEADGETLIGLNLSIPLFVRNRFSDEVSAARARRRQAQQLADDVMQRAYARVVSAAERYDLSRGAWDDWQRTGVASLNRQTEQLQRLWEAGELSSTDYLVQLTATLDVQESALELREALWRAWFEWLWASGQVDAWLGQGASR